LSEGFDGSSVADNDHEGRGLAGPAPFRSGEPKTCRDCGSAQWLIGRHLAECGRCGGAVPLAEVKLTGAGAFRSRRGWWHPRETRSYLIRSGASFAAY
jgi:hypothetical protein